jgi:hypothetical protein
MAGLAKHYFGGGVPMMLGGLIGLCNRLTN